MRSATLIVALLVAATAASGAECGGDCDGDGAVEVEELVGLVACALDLTRPLEPCLACGDDDGSGAVEVHELLRAVAHALAGCAQRTFSVSVYLREHLSGGGYYRGGCVRLDPLGRYLAQDLHSGEFRIDGVPPGHYDLRVGCGESLPCNPFGCWPRHTALNVVDRDAGLTLPLRVGCRERCEGGGQVCVPPDGFLCGICRDDPDECGDDLQCGRDRVCIPTRQQICPCDGSPAMVCRTVCRGDADCPDGERCGGDGRCARPSCASDADCGDGVCLLSGCYDELGTCQVPPP